MKLLLGSFLALLILPLVLGGCTYGNEISSEVTMLGQAGTPSPPDRMDIVFDDGKPVPRQYEQIALIEVKGARTSRTADLLAEMKSRAAGLGADAVVAVKTHYISREEGEILSELLDRDKNRPEKYETIALTGLAVHYVDQQKPVDTPPKE